MVLASDLASVGREGFPPPVGLFSLQALRLLRPCLYYLPSTSASAWVTPAPSYKRPAPPFKMSPELTSWHPVWPSFWPRSLLKILARRLGETPRSRPHATVDPFCPLKEETGAAKEPGTADSAEAIRFEFRTVLVSWLVPAGREGPDAMPKSCMTRPSGGSARLRKNPSGCCFQWSLLSACSSHGSTRHVKNCMQTYDQKSPVPAASRGGQNGGNNPVVVQIYGSRLRDGLYIPPRPDCPGASTL